MQILCNDKAGLRLEIAIRGAQLDWGFVLSKKERRPCGAIASAGRSAGWFTLIIADHGPGIGERDSEKVFNRIFRAPNANDEIHGSRFCIRIPD